MIRTLATISAFALFATATAVHADQPMQLTDAQLDGVTAGGANLGVTIGADNPAFENFGRGSIRNIHNTDLHFFRFGGLIALPGVGGEHANIEDSAFLNSKVSLIQPEGLAP